MIILWLLEGFEQTCEALAVRLGIAKKRAPHLELGRRGEDAAYYFLRRRGYTIVASDWRSGKVRGDLDLVAWDGDTLCVIEVKARSSRTFATAESSIDDDKVHVLRRLARQYVRQLPKAPKQLRFDVVTVYEDKKPAEITLIRNAFAGRSGLQRGRYWAS